jgi:hypothetical protein
MQNASNAQAFAAFRILRHESLVKAVTERAR